MVYKSEPEKWATWPGEDREALEALIRAQGHSVEGWTNGKPITTMPDDKLEALASTVMYGQRPSTSSGPRSQKPRKPRRRRGRPRKTEQ